MGNTDSNTKSSLLKNFPYMIQHDGGRNTKLLYFDYLNFLHYELQHKAWEWETYTRYVTGGGGGGGKTDDERVLFCGWKEIQEKIFNKLNEQLKVPNKYDWNKDVLPLINIREKQFSSTQDCKNVTVDFSKISELESPEFPALTPSQTKSCGNLKTASNLHIPLRRRALLVKDIYDYLKEIENEFTSKITDKKSLEDVLKGKTIKVNKTDKNFNLTKDVVQGIVETFGEFIYKKYNDNEHEAFCNEWKRTMNDYYTLLQGIDIVDDKETNDLQCLIKKIEENVGNKEEFKREWRNYFRDLVKDLQTKEFTNKITKKPCEIYASDSSQCVRFFEEWAEEFCKLKKELGELIVSQCKGNTTNENCRGLCGIYKNLIEVSKPYFENYKTICAKKEFGSGEKETDLQKTFINAVENSTTECCTELGNCSEKELFNVNEDKGNIKYKCLCDDGEYKKNPSTDTEKKCQQYKNTATVVGRTLAEPQLSGMSLHSGPGSVPSTPQCAKNKSGGVKTAKDIAGVFRYKANEEANDPSNVDTQGKSDLIGKLSEAKFGKDGSEKGDDVCKLDMKKHTNDSRKNNGSYEGPCTGKGTDIFNIGDRWTTDEKVNDNHKGVLFPPRRKNMCTSNLENLNTGYTGLNNFIFASHSLLADVMLSAKYEAENIIKQYKKQNSITNLTEQKDKDTVCRAMKYSFADLGDIIRGRDLWNGTNNTEMQQLETKLKEIFGKIQENVTTGAKYKKDPQPYTKLRDAWWSQNRDQIWKAMTTCGEANGICDKGGSGSTTVDRKGYRSQRGHSRGRNQNSRSPGISGATLSSGATSVPHDDYIPQRLRWLTEWAEWYCKRQSQLYTQVKEKCGECKDIQKGGTSVSCEKCTGCPEACENYQTFVKDWQKDWDKQKDQYSEFYQKATQTTSGSTTTTGNDLNTQYLNEFLKTLHTKNNENPKSSGNNNPYTTAGGYVQQELKNMECKGQTAFCDSGSDNYAFKERPPVYEKACSCTEPVKAKPQAPAPTISCTGHKILDAANMRHHNISQELKTRDTDNKLKGELKNAEFGKGKTKLGDGENACSLDKMQHTNDVREQNQREAGPCSGKGTDRFNIGAEWQKGGDTNMRSGHEDVLLPPRRQHMCTSNLENLGKSGNLGKTLSDMDAATLNHSFLGDVLLAAKYEGEFISHNLHGSDICTAMKYSFADLGDIIRGKDMWSGEKNTDMKKLQTHLEAIFKKIQQNLPDNIQTKYNDTNGGKHTQLRSDWWSANRDQIWKAITCSAPHTADLYIPSPGTTKKFHPVKCGRDKYTPVDDYIPQRLRWMTEWTENYCKQLDRHYRSVQWVCGMCKGFKNSKKQNQENEEAKKKMCKWCVDMCAIYTGHVTKWKTQWEEQQSKQYSKLYKEANNGSTSSKSTGDPITVELNEFLKKIKGPHKDLCKGDPKDNNNYDNLATYVTNMGGTKNCIDAKQSKFEDNTSDNEYAFREQPHTYDTECKWQETQTTPPAAPPSTPVAPKTPNGKDACEIVKEILPNQNTNGSVGSCMKKYNDKTPHYPEWDCEKNQTLIRDSDRGACMPPRRQKLCLAYFTNMSGTEGKEKLREAFIKTAAAETFLHWNYYINHGNGKDKGFDKKLKEGKIPPDFLRSMFYTYGDYRDLCLGTDMGTSQHTKNIGKTVTTILKNGNKEPTEEERESWWEDNGLDIWQGMLCALSHAAGGDKDEVQKKLTEKYKYDSENLKTQMDLNIMYTHITPQFFRWFIEWSDQFCEEQSKKYIELLKKCMTCEVKDGSSSNGKAICKDKTQCTQCHSQCQTYTEFINKWKPEYIQQKDKFDKVKDQEPYVYVVEDQNTPAHKFLYQSLQLFGVDGDCMKYKSSQPNSGGNVEMPQSLDKYPPPHDEYKNKCECQDEVATKKPATTTTSGGDTTASSVANGSSNKCGDNKDQSLDGTVNKGGTHFLGKKGSSGNSTEEKPLKEISNSYSYLGRGSANPCKNNSINDKNWICDRNGKNDEYKPKDDNVCLPPRTQSLCVGNLDADPATRRKPQPKIDAVDDAQKMLTEVLIAAHYEGENLSKNYNPLKDNSPYFCSKVKYSFGDLADIIKGTSIYDLKSGDKTEENLETIFGKIYKGLGNDQSKYKNSDGKPDYKKLREDWWNANREYVWKVLADKAAPTSTLPCLQEDKTPNIDCRPQFLRWLEEWGEQYCVKQSQAYKEVQNACSNCSVTNGSGSGAKPTCNKSEEKCKQCQAKCEDYQKMVKQWQPQWDKQKDKYLKLYQAAQNGSSGTVSPQDQQVIHHLKTLSNGGADTKYNSAGGYLKEKGYIKECQQQTDFDNTSDTKYAFANYPQDHKDKCTCVNQVATKPEVPRPQAAKPAATKPATTKPVEKSQVARAAEPPPAQPGAGKGSPVTKGQGKDKGSPNGPTGVLRSGGTTQIVSLDSVDNGVPSGKGLVINQGTDGTAKVDIQISSGSTQPEPPHVDPAGDPGAPDSPSSSSSSGGGNPQAGSGGPGGTSHVDNTGAISQQPAKDPNLLQKIAGGLGTLAGLGTVLGTAGTLGAMSVATSIIPRAIEVAKPIAQKVGKSVISGISDMLATDPGAQAPQAAVLQPSVEPVQPSSSLDSGGSGTGSTAQGGSIDTGGSHTQPQPQAPASPVVPGGGGGGTSSQISTPGGQASSSPGQSRGTSQGGNPPAQGPKPGSTSGKIPIETVLSSISPVGM
ncbi:erythrocyte membrane protein 1, PfEMP1, putative [Plasmodium gaboni]|uniref:Erythrocyte membrane protein 1, PfEMP1, putative n=1 Tax=Plasmodium gaboni TaxID=647221 RepID=A0ABY0KVX6_9APIC|nr:erythrocyte membrane protein 1, PfEMP1, putative [Plasmodium gaboni]